MIKLLRNKVFQGSLWYTLVGLLTSGISFILLPIMTRWMDPKEFGILNSAMALSLLIMPFATAGLGNAVVRYYHEYEKERFVCFFSSAFWFQIGVGLLVVFLISLLFLSGVISEVAGVDWVHLLPVLLIVLFNPPRDIGAQLLTTQEKHSKASVNGIIAFIVGTAFSIWFICSFDMGALGRLYGRFLGALCAVFLIMRLPEVRSSLKLVFDRKEIKKALKFGLPYIPYAFAIAGMLSADKLVLQHYEDMESVGIYSAAKTLTMGMSFVFVAMTRAWYPRYFALCNQGDKRGLLKGQWSILCVLAVTVVGFVILAPVVFPLMVDKRYTDGVYLLPVLAFGIYLYGLFSTQTSFITYLKKTNYLPLLAGSGALCSIFLSMILIPKMQMTGAGWAILGGYSMMIILLFFISAKYKENLLERVWLPIISMLVAGAGVMCATQIPVQFGWGPRMMLSILACVLFGVIWFFGGKVIMKSLKCEEV